VLEGTFSKAMPDGTIAPTGKAFAIGDGRGRDLEPTGHDGRGVLLWDDQALYAKVGLG